jgi:hypothetical protein
VVFLDKDDSHTLLLLQERGGGKNPGAGGVILLLRVDDGDDHGIEFLSELDGLGSLTCVVSGHRTWCHGARGGSVDHQRCSERREGGRPLGFERNGSKKNLGSDYHVGERCAAEYWMCIALRYWYIYVGVPLHNPGEGSYVGAGDLTSWGHGETARGGGARETLKPWTPHPGGTPNGSGRPDTGGGPRPMYLYHNTFSNRKSLVCGRFKGY